LTDFLAVYSAVDITIIAAIFIIGGIVKGALGFGLPLVTMAILPLVMPVEVALAINALATPFNNFAQFVGARRVRETIYRFRHVLVGIAVGVPLGALFVSIVNDQVLLIALGSFVLIFTTFTIASPAVTIPARSEHKVGGITGLVAGVIGALTTANGPVFVMYLVGLRVDRTLFVSALGLFFIVTGVTLTGSFLAVGLLTLPVLILSAICIPASHVGMKLGNWLAAKVPAERFRNVVLVTLAALGVNLLVQGLSI
jgi:uncharacterized protein